MSHFALVVIHKQRTFYVDNLHYCQKMVADLCWPQYSIARNIARPYTNMYVTLGNTQKGACVSR